MAMSYKDGPPSLGGLATSMPVPILQENIIVSDDGVLAPKKGRYGSLSWVTPCHDSGIWGVFF